MVQRMVGDALRWFALVAIVALVFAASFVATLHTSTSEVSSGSGAVSGNDDCSSINELSGSVGSALLLLGQIIVGTVDVTNVRYLQNSHRMHPPTPQPRQAPATLPKRAC
eukprot:6146196-Prymnesium_polylepis.1